MEKALPKKVGTQSGLNVPIQPSALNRAKVGTIKTGNGIIIVAMVIPKKRSRPGHLILAKE